VKTWIYKGDILPEVRETEIPELQEGSLEDTTEEKLDETESGEVIEDVATQESEVSQDS
jgi:hypothetical protein